MHQVLLEIQNLKVSLEERLDKQIEAINATTSFIEKQVKLIDTRVKKMENLYPHWTTDARHPLEKLQSSSFLSDINQILPQSLRLTDKSNQEDYLNAKKHMWLNPLIQSTAIDIQLKRPKPFMDRANNRIITYSTPAKIIHASSVSGDIFRKRIWRHQVPDKNTKPRPRWVVDVAFGDQFQTLRKNKTTIAKVLTQMKAEKIVQRFDIRYVTCPSGNENVTLDISISTKTKNIPFGRLLRSMLADGNIITDTNNIRTSVEDVIHSSPIQDKENMEVSPLNTPPNAPSPRNPPQKRGSSNMTPAYLKITKKGENYPSDDSKLHEGVNRALFKDQSSDTSENEIIVNDVQFPALGKLDVKSKKTRKKKYSAF